MIKTFKAEILEPGTIASVFGIDGSYHGVAKILETCHTWLINQGDMYRPASYKIRFIEPATENAKNWNNGSMEGEWVGDFEALQNPEEVKEAVGCGYGDIETTVGGGRRGTGNSIFLEYALDTLDSPGVSLKPLKRKERL